MRWVIGVLLLLVTAATSGYILTRVHARGFRCDEPVWDSGIISDPTEVIRHEFVFRNLANASVRVTGVSTSCGCLVTDANIGETEIAVGQEFRLPVVFDPPDTPGPFSKRIAVRWLSATADEATQALEVGGNVDFGRNFFCAPQLLNFGAAVTGESSYRVLQVCSYSEEQVAPIEIVTSDSQLTCDEQEVDLILRRVRITLRFDAGSSKGGQRYDGSVSVKVKGNKLPLVVPVVASVQTSPEEFR